jgi:hypothetical protein
VLTALIDERVLDGVVGDATVVAHQLRSLSTATHRPRTHIRTVPHPQSPAPTSSFAYLHFPTGSDLTCLEHEWGAVYLDDTEPHRHVLDGLALTAHGHSDTRHRLAAGHRDSTARTLDGARPVRR